MIILCKESAEEKLRNPFFKPYCIDLCISRLASFAFRPFRRKTIEKLSFDLCHEGVLKIVRLIVNECHIPTYVHTHTSIRLKRRRINSSSFPAFGDAFAAIGVREPQPRASEAFRQFGEQHRQMEKFGVAMLKAVKPILSDLGTYLHKAIPDTRLTISKYADAKFEYLSYCLKVKELDDEEKNYAALQEPLYRVETGNYEYRLVLRCRQEARSKFARLRSDVLVKLELLDNKHVQDVVWQLQKFASGLAKCHAESRDLLCESTLFPVEVDLSRSAFQYKTTGPLQPSVEDSEDGDEEEDGKVNENEETPMLDLQDNIFLSTELNRS